MTICNMTIEGGARAGLIAPDEKIFEYLKGKPMSPKGSLPLTFILKFFAFF